MPDAADGSQKGAGRLSSRLILVANVREKSILVPSVWFPLALLQSHPSYFA
jgi:hypothetical protein